MSIVKIKDLVFHYIRRDEEGEITEKIRAIDGVNIDINKGDFVAVLGHNGSGKSSLAKHLNALLLPEQGSVWIGGKDTKKKEELWNIRQMAGMVFQNPDNQIIGAIVEEDVAFGPENLGVPTEEIWKRVENSLKATGMEAYRLKSPNRLSGGQKQRIAISGVVAMEPECIILDEPTAMLDPGGRKDVIETIRRLNKEKNITIILITHNMEEVVDADHIFVMNKGKVMMEGNPHEVFAHVEQLKQWGLEVPFATELAWRLKKKGLSMPQSIVKEEELVDVLCQLR